MESESANANANADGGDDEHDGDLFLVVGEDEDEDEDEDENGGVGPGGALLHLSSADLDLDDAEAPVPPLQLKLLYSQSPKRMSIGSSPELLGGVKPGMTTTPVTLVHAVKMRDRLSQPMGSARAERLGPFSSRSGRRHLLRSLSFGQGGLRGGIDSQRSSARGASARAVSSRGGTHMRSQSVHAPSNFSARRSIRSGRSAASSPVRSKSARVGGAAKSVRFQTASGAPMAPLSLAQHKRQVSGGPRSATAALAGSARPSPPMTPQTPMTPGTLAPALPFEDASSRLHEVAERLGEAFLASELWAFAAVRRRQQSKRITISRGRDSLNHGSVPRVAAAAAEAAADGEAAGATAARVAAAAAAATAATAATAAATAPAPVTIGGIESGRGRKVQASSLGKEEQEGAVAVALQVFDQIRQMQQRGNKADSLRVCKALQACVSATEESWQRIVSKLTATLLIKAIVQTDDEFDKMSTSGDGSSGLALASSTMPWQNPCSVLMLDVVGLSASAWLSARGFDR